MSSWSSAASDESKMSTFPWVHYWDFVDTYHTLTPGYAKRATKMFLGELTLYVGSLSNPSA